MRTPIDDYIRAYIASNATRLHMPGHKGSTAPEDITEIDGADVLYHSNGIIAQSQRYAAELFGSAKTVYSTEGSSLAIRAMLYLMCLYAGKKPVIAAGRNAHKTFVTAAALLDIDVQWLWPEDQKDILSCTVEPVQLDAFLQKHKVDGVYITSPDYLGKRVDISAIAEVCHAHGSLLLVDNAHGAYLRFLDESLHPLDLGADMCCDSAHKTLPVLTGGAYLHIAHRAPEMFCLQAERAMSVFASTSPSYMILRSLDLCNRYLAQDYCPQLRSFLPIVQQFKDKLTAAGYRCISQEPLKSTIAPKSFGYTGAQLAQILQTHNLICEFSDPDYLVLMLTPENGQASLKLVESILLALPRKSPILEVMPQLHKPEAVVSMQKAMLQCGAELPLRECVGKILCAPTVSCPPAVPIVVSGERITEDVVAVMEYYDIDHLYVI